MAAIRTADLAQHAFPLPVTTLRRLHNVPARAVLWAAVFTLFLVALLT